MPAKEILAAIREPEAAGWVIRISGGYAHAYAKAYCPGGPDGCDPFSINATPTVPGREARRIRRALKRCKHGGYAR